MAPWMASFTSMSVCRAGVSSAAWSCGGGGIRGIREEIIKRKVREMKKENRKKSDRQRETILMLPCFLYHLWRTEPGYCVDKRQHSKKLEDYNSVQDDEQWLTSSLKYMPKLSQSTPAAFNPIHAIPIPWDCMLRDYFCWTTWHRFFLVLNFSPPGPVNEWAILGCPF